MVSRSKIVVCLWAVALLTCRSEPNDDANPSFNNIASQEVAALEDYRRLQESTAPTMAPSPGPSFTDEFPIAFRVVWNLGFSNETTIRVPTEEEMTGLFYATLNWMSDSAKEYYADQRNVTVLDRIEFSHYGANFNASEAYPSTVAMECICYFQADSRAKIPSVFQFLVAFSAHFNRTTFVDDYLPNADPETNIYRNVTDLRYNILPSNLGLTQVAAFAIETITLDTEWKYEIGFGIPDRSPTVEEIEGLQAATNEWLTEDFMNAYPPNANGVPAFHMLTSNIYSQTYNATQDPPHTVRVLTDVSFRIPAESTTTFPIVKQDLWNVLEGADLTDYRNNYLYSAEPLLSIFTGVLTVSWTPLEGNY